MKNPAFMQVFLFNQEALDTPTIGLSDQLFYTI